MVIIFIGPPGSGKGTQANLLKNQYNNLIIITVSNLLIEKSSDGSDFGNEIKEKMDKGELIEDTVVNDVLSAKLNFLKGKNILIDGYPRSLTQAKFLKQFLINDKSKFVINFNVDKEVLRKRIEKRAQIESRKDDNVFDKRFDIFLKSNEEIINYLKTHFELKNIEANSTPEAINVEIQRFLRD